MADLQQIKIVEKFKGTPLEFVTSVRSIGTPTLIQPVYTFDVSDMYGIFIPEVSFGYGFEWVNGYLDVSSVGVSSLSALSDVSIYGLINNQILVYDNSISKWKNSTSIDGSLYDVVDASLYLWLKSVKLLRESSLGNDFVWNAGVLNTSLNYWPKTIPVVKESSLGSDFTWNAGILDVSAVFNVTVDISSLQGIYVKESSLGDDFEFVNGKLSINHDSSIEIANNVDIYIGGWRIVSDGTTLRFFNPLGIERFRFSDSGIGKSAGVYYDF